MGNISNKFKKEKNNNYKNNYKNNNLSNNNSNKDNNSNNNNKINLSPKNLWRPPTPPKNIKNKRINNTNNL